MSEYQYYEFHTIDRALTQEERAEINTWSSRSTASATSVSFEYSYGSFSKDPEKVVLKYFDAMLYIANWGARQIIFRFPEALVEFDELKKYRYDDGNEYECGIHIKRKGNYILLIIRDHEEDGLGWIEENDSLVDMLPLRSNIIQGDYRVLYLAWLHFLSVSGENEEVEKDEEFLEIQEPPVPANFGRPNKALDTLVDFFEMDSDLIKIAKQGSSEVPKVANTNWRYLLTQLSEKEKTAFLMQLIEGDIHVAHALKKRLVSLKPQKKQSSKNRRSRGEVLALIEDIK